MADHLVDEPPAKRTKMRDPFAPPPRDSSDVLSNMDMFDLEKDLPDELMSSGSWGEQPGGSGKPPAQGPGPGPGPSSSQQQQPQTNGDDAAAVRQMQINHLIQQQQQGNKNQLGHNQMAMAALGNKSPNLQSPPNVAVSKDQMGALHQSLMPNTSHPNQHHATMPMSSMQAMNVGSVGSGTGGMIMTNSNMGGGVMGVGGVGMVGGALVVNNVNKQPLSAGLMGPGHHPQHLNLPQGAMQNGPMLARVALQQQQQQHASHLGQGVVGAVRPGPSHHLAGQRVAGPNHPHAPYHPSYTAPQGSVPAQMPAGVAPSQRGVGVPTLVGLGVVGGVNRFGTPVESANVPNSAGGMAGQAVPPAPSPHQPLSGAPSSSQPGPQAATQAISCAQPQPPASIADPEKRKLIQQQLVLLLHAHKCQRRESQSNGEAWQCALPHCKTMKGVLNHMMICTAGKSCDVPHCSSSRQIINHWKNCTRSDCPVCLPLKQADKNRSNNLGGAGGQAAVPNSTPNPSPSDVRRAYDALGMQCPTSAAGPSSSLNPGAPQIPAVIGTGPGTGPVIGNNSIVRPGAPTVPNAVRCAGPRPPGGINVPVGSDSSQQQQNSLTLQLYNQSNQASQPSVSIPTSSQEVAAQLVLNTANLPLSSGQVTANPASGTKEWHQSITSDLRNHLVHKLVQAIFPTPDPTAMLDKRMHNLVAYARKVEGDMYEMAATRSEYYHLLAEKIYKIQKELEEKRQKRKEQQLQAQNNVTSNVAVVRPPMTPGNSNLPRPALNQQPSAMRSHSPGMGLAIPPNRMQFQPNLVGPPGPSPNAHPPTPNASMVVSNPGLSPFGQPMPSPASNISNSSAVQNQFSAHANGSNVLGSSPMSNQQFPDIMKARLNSSQVSNGTSNSQAPSPYMTQNQFGNRMPIPSSSTSIASDQVSMASQMSSAPASVGSQKGASPGLTGVASNGPVPPRTPSTPLIPPPMPSPLPPSSQDQVPNVQEKGLPVSRFSSALSSQMAALNAAAALDQEDSPRPSQSHSNMSGGKLDIKQEDDKKDDLEDSLSNHGGGKNMNDIKKEIKSEPMDSTDSEIKTESTNQSVKDEPMSPSTELKPIIPEPIQNQSFDKKRKCAFKPEELRQALMPTLERLFRQDPESIPFRQPVDPQQLGIPDYFEIVKIPMDLSTIKKKLDDGKYSDPWGYVDDVWQMFDNAWLYNRKTSRVYRYCTKLSEVFESEIDPVMQNLGYCCGRKYTFNPQVLCCYGKQLCTIPRDAKYFSYQNRYTFCQKCFNDIVGDTVQLGDDQMQPQTSIKKDQFMEMKNDRLELEPFVLCLDCGRKQHQICVLHLDQIWPSGFVCKGCLKKKGEERKENKYNAKKLATSILGTYIETRVNNFLKKKEAGAGEVSIRVVASSDKFVDVKPGMKSRFVDGGELSARFPYRAKALFAFEEIDGADVCFFGMHVQEYGSECPMPNRRRVYIAYLDSVHFFKPRHCRTAVYHEILLGYLDYAKQLGYTMAHIWACPPSEGDDYIFHCHPVEQKIPKPKRLQEWYKKMLDKGICDRIIVDYKDILKQAMEDSISSAADLPYFEGDFWPNVLEESIKELDQEEEEKRKQAEAAEAAQIIQLSEDSEQQGPDGKKKGQKKAKKSNKSKAAQRRSSKKHNDQQTVNDLSAKIFATMEKHKEVFFVIRLHSAQSAASLAAIQDPDPLLNCDLMDGRDAFLTMARDRHYEFSSMRRAQFSTLCMLWELHNQVPDKFVYTCNSCKTNVETRYQCTVCDDYDLCVICYKKDGHQHKMEKLGLDIDDGSSPGDMKQANPQEARKLSIQRCIQSLVHACQCRDANCRLPSCQKMKRVVMHTRICKRKTNGGCSICKQLIALCCYHAKHCQETKCLVPFCSNIKHKLKQQRMQQRLQTEQMTRRRVAVMTRTTTSMSSSGSSPPPPPAPPNLASPPLTGSKPAPATHTLSPNVLQVVKEVQEEAARQHYGKAAQQMPPPQQHMQPRHPLHPMDQWGPQRYAGKPQQPLRPPIPMSQSLNHPQLAQMRPQTQHLQHPGHPQQQLLGQQNNPQQIMGMVSQQQQPPNQGMPNQMGNVSGMVGGPPRAPVGQVRSGMMGNPQHHRALQQLMATLKSPTSPDQQQQILEILKSNPPLMAAFIKQRQNAQQNQQQAGGGIVMQSVGGATGAGAAGMPQVPPQQQQQQQQQQRMHPQMHQLLGPQQQQVGGVGNINQINNMGSMNPQQHWSTYQTQQMLNNMQRNQQQVQQQQQQQVQQQQGFVTPPYGGRGVGGVNVGVGNTRYFAPNMQQLLQRSPPSAPSPQPQAQSEMMLIHQSPAPSAMQPTDDQLPPMTPQDQLSKFVEQL